MPINGIIRFSDSLLEKPSALDENQHKLCRMISNCGKQLMCHTRDLLDNNLLGGGKIAPIICLADLRQTVDDCVLLNRMQAD